MTGIRVVQDAFPNRRHDVPKHGLQVIKRISLSHVVGIIVPITEPLAVGRILPICDFAAYINNYIIKTAAQIAKVFRFGLSRSPSIATAISPRQSDGDGSGFCEKRRRSPFFLFGQEVFHLVLLGQGAVLVSRHEAVVMTAVATCSATGAADAIGLG